MPLTVALVAEEAAGARTLQLLADRGHEVAAVFTGVAGAGTMSPVAARARSLGISLRDARDVRDAATADWIRDAGIELLLNVHSLHIVAAAVLTAPTLGAYNLHPGP
ncbi:MAG TPA: hypothetical protein VE127_10780, partial [Solirubrobacteraceae bacterium]|nr:hypothetical protein [Solirubrobacteraceae bacterium]